MITEIGFENRFYLEFMIKEFTNAKESLEIIPAPLFKNFLSYRIFSDSCNSDVEIIGKRAIITQKVEFKENYGIFKKFPYV